MSESLPWLSDRHARLPKWAQHEIHALLCERINRDFSGCLQGDIRRMAKRALGGHCTFADDDLHLLTLLAEAAIDAVLHAEITDRRTLANIEKAKAIRAEERALVKRLEDQGA